MLLQQTFSSSHARTETQSERLQLAAAVAQARAADSAEVLRHVRGHLEHVERRHREHLLQRRVRLDDAPGREVVPMRVWWVELNYLPTYWSI